MMKTLCQKAIGRRKSIGSPSNFRMEHIGMLWGCARRRKLEGEDGIKDQDYSLNLGRYVGVVIEDDGLTQDEFKQRMMAYYTELSKLNEQAHGLESKIAETLKELFQ